MQDSGLSVAVREYLAGNIGRMGINGTEKQKHRRVVHLYAKKDSNLGCIKGKRCDRQENLLI